MDPGVLINHALIQSDCWDKGDFIFKLVTAVTTQVVKTCKQIAGVTVIFMGMATFFHKKWEMDSQRYYPLKVMLGHAPFCPPLILTE